MSIIRDNEVVQKKVKFRIFDGTISELERTTGKSFEQMKDESGNEIKIDASGKGVTPSWAKMIAIDSLKENGINQGADHIINVTYSFKTYNTHAPNSNYSHLQLAESHEIITVQIEGYAIKKKV